MKWLVRTGEVLVSPRSVFHRAVYRQEGGMGDILLLMFFVMLGTAPADVGAVLTRAGHGIGWVLSRLLALYLNFSLLVLLICLFIGLILAGVGRLRGHRVSIQGVVVASTYLWVPVGVLGLLGSMLRAIGLELWLTPHLPLVFFLRLELSWWMIVLRSVVAYGWSIYLGWILVSVIHEQPPEREANGSSWPGWILGGWILFSYVLGGVFVGKHYDQIRSLRVHDQAPGFELPMVGAKKKLALSSLSGKAVVVEFWADWCSKCVEHMPDLLGWAKQHPEVSVLAVHQGKTVEQVRSFVLEEKKWEHAIFLVDDQGQASSAYRLESLPMLFVISPNGSIVATHQGVPPPGWLDRLNWNLSKEP